MLMRNFRQLLLSCLACISLLCRASASDGHPLGAWCWFADPRAVHHRTADGTINKTYIGYIDTHGNIKAMQYDFKSQRQVEVLVRSWFQPDDHNNPTFLVLPDNRVMVFYSRHTDEPCFYYRVTSRQADLATLGEEKVIKTKDNTTYPSPFILSDDPAHFYLCWRGIGWHPTIARLTLPAEDDEVTVDWGPYRMVKSTGARPYAKYVSDGKSRIWMAYTTGHPDNECPNHLYLNYVDIHDGTLRDVRGNLLQTIAGRPFAVSKRDDYARRWPLTLVDRPADKRDWVFQVAADTLGRPAVAMVRISEDKRRHTYCYIRWNGKAWTETLIGDAGGHFHQSPELEHCYSAGMAIDPDSVNIVYASLPVGGKHGDVYELFRFELAGNGTVKAKRQLTFNSAKNNVRPFVIPGSKGSPLRLSWMAGDYYDWIVSSRHPQGYSTVMRTDFEGFAPAKEPRKVSRKRLARMKWSARRPFTFVTTVFPNEALRADGCLLKAGELSCWLDAKTLKPEWRFRGRTFRSANTLGSSDRWREAPRATDGRWLAPLVPDSVQLKLVCCDGTLSIYRDGMLSQTICDLFKQQ